MALCDTCNAKIDTGANFCSSCGTVLNESYLPSNVSKTSKLLVIFYAALMTGTLLITVFMYLLIPESVYLVLPAAVASIGVIITVHISRHSSRHFSFFIAIIAGILTLGCTLIFLNAATFILPAGFTLMALILTFYNSRQSTRDWWFFAVLALVISATGIGAIFSSYLGYSNVLLGSFLLVMVIILFTNDL